jgi:hypothetical protein
MLAYYLKKKTYTCILIPVARFCMETMNELNYFNDYNDNKMGDIFLQEFLVNISCLNLEFSVHIQVRLISYNTVRNI